MSDEAKAMEAARRLDDPSHDVTSAGFAADAIRVATFLLGKAPLPLILTCPSCSGRHVDKGEFATKPHHTHACQHCGMVWRPALIPTVGVQFLPGFKDVE